MTNKEAFAEVRLAPSTTGPTEPAGTVIDSLQLLRTSLEDVAVSELSGAIENLSALKSRLDSLQRIIAVIAAMKNCEPQVRSARDEVNADVKRMGEETLTNPWLFATLLKQRRPEFSGPADSCIETFTAPMAEAETGAATPAVINEVAEFIPGDEPAGPLEPLPANHDFDVRPGEVDEQTEGSIVNLNFRFQQERDLADETSAGSDPILLQSFEVEVPENTPVETNGALSPHSAAELDLVNANDARHESAPPKGANAPQAGAPADFDTKLLDDLIKNYGEFVASSPARPVAKEFEGFERTEASAENETAVAPVPVSANALAGSNQHELDRELKKIIKDYGEVDLYSAGNRVTKRRAIVAFVVLGGVLSSIYLFSGPKADTVGSTPPVHRNQSMVDPSAASSDSDGRSTIEAEDGAAVNGRAQQSGSESSGNPQPRQRFEKIYRKGGLQ